MVNFSALFNAGYIKSVLIVALFRDIDKWSREFEKWYV